MTITLNIPCLAGLSAADATLAAIAVVLAIPIVVALIKEAIGK